MKSNKAKTEFFLRSLPPYYVNTFENIWSKDYIYNDTTRKLQEYVKKGPKREGTTDNLVVLKEEVKGKWCTYCRSKGQSRRGHIEENC